MSVSEFVQYLLDSLGPLGELRARAMFGGYGVYADEVFFAIVDDDVVYFRVGEEDRVNYESAGSRPFSYVSRGQRRIMRSYWQVPVEVLDSAPQLQRWAKAAIHAQAHKKKPRSRKR